VVENADSAVALDAVPVEREVDLFDAMALRRTPLRRRALRR
jgi:hypothetical protein